VPPSEIPGEPAPRSQDRAGQRRLPISWPRVQLAGVKTDLLEVDDAIGLIISHARQPTTDVLGVVSVNLDHLHHFGSGRTSANLQRRTIIDLSIDGHVRWLGLLDGAPLVHRARELTGQPWPRLAGSDLMEPILDQAQRFGLSIGFLGGSSSTHEELSPILARRWPNLRVGGFWSPSRAQLTDPQASAALVAEIKAAEVQILAVCLGKPRQERWIAENSRDSGVKVCLAFGAVVDFLAGRVDRAPRWASDHGFEWAWRLGKEPRRLARRYLVQGPGAYAALQRDSYVKMPTTYFAEPAATQYPMHSDSAPGRFASAGEVVDVAVVAVTCNNAEDIDTLVTSVRHQLADQRIRMIVVDNGSEDATLERVRQNDDVITVAVGGNIGYAGGINMARPHIGAAGAVLIVNPDLEIAPGSIQRLRERLEHDGVGVAVPRILDANGEVYASLRREPTLRRAIGDALFGERLGGRPAHFSEIELDRHQYRHPHQVDWATGAALMISADVWSTVGEWDEQYFLYSEEIDYLSRVRDHGYSVWFEPEATMQLRRGGSGSSDQLEALMAVNRVRYAEKWHGRSGATPFHAAVILGSLLRAKQNRHRVALRYLTRRKRWSELPHAQRGNES
jgi:exopolysaccharide biosynthesis WecB/TagA/CpsF family protein